LSQQTVDIRRDVTAYAEGVVSGKITAGKWVRLACERFLRDLDDPGDYYFDWDLAENACLIFPLIFRHYKGEWAGQPIELCDFQKFVTANIIGWKHKQTDFRRFRRAFVSVARKNGKTTWAAGLAILFAFFDGEAAAEVYIGATKREQAAILFTDAKQMIAASQTLSKHADSRVSVIQFPATHSLIRPLGSDKPYDGLNPHAIFLDELHAWVERHRKFYDTMRTGSGARRQPLLCTITTAGDDKSELWKDEVGYCKLILEQQAADPQLFAYVAELDDDDDPFDESTWAKANPGLGQSVKLDYLREQAAEAKAKQTAKNRFLRYHCNRMTSSTEHAIDVRRWDELGTGLTEWEDADAIAAGFDLGGRDDLASWAVVARFRVGEDEDERPIYRYECKQRSYMFADTRRDLSLQPFASFISQGLIDVGKYALDSLRDDLIKECEDWSISEIAFDPYQANVIAGHLEQEGLKPIRMPQNYLHFNEPIRAFLQAITEGRFSHSGSDSLLRYCVQNAVIVRDRADRWMFDKSNSRDKIDPVVAVVMAFRACMSTRARAHGSMFIS
jgi:phage terminase large subunit-like protein